MVVGLALVAGAVRADPETPKGPAASCSVCSSQTQCPAMMSVKCEMINIANGTATLMTVTDPTKIADFRQGWDQCQGEINKAMKMSRSEAQSHLCGMCRGYYDLIRQGAHLECVQTETGALMLLTAKKSKTVEAIRSQTARVREMMTKKESCCQAQTTTQEQTTTSDPE
jgi:hypothetical protein